MAAKQPATRARASHLLLNPNLFHLLSDLAGCCSFGQAPGLLSGTNHLLLVSVNKHSSLEQALSGLLDWLK